MKKILLFVPALLLALGTMKAQTILYTQDMESTSGTALPTGWTQTTLATDGGWLSGTALNSTYFGITAHTRYLATNDDQCNCNKNNDFLQSGTISLSGSTYPQLTFDLFYYHNSYNPAGTVYTESGTVEVSTNGGSTWTVVATLSGNAAWNNVAVDLTTYAGQSIMLGFRYSDGGGTGATGIAAAWMWGMAIDNVTIIEPVVKEVAVTNVVMAKYIVAGATTVNTIMTSNGGPQVTSATLKYSVDGGAPVSQTFTPNIYYGGSYTASFTTQANLTAGLHYIKSWISDVNGTGSDATPMNDTASCQVTSIAPANVPVHDVLIEEFTGAWCGYCPRGGLALSAICASDPHVHGAAIHDNDQMSTTESNIIDVAYEAGYPSGTVDRSYNTTHSAYAIDNSYWAAATTAREAVVVPASVALSNVTWTSGSRQISATVTTHIAGDIKGTYSVNLFVIENRVYGPLADITDNGYNNHSYYYADNTSPFYNVGLTTGAWTTGVAGLTPAVYQHNHVVDKMIGGAYGDNSIIASTLVTAGTNIPHTFTWTLPAGNTTNAAAAHRYNEDNCYVIAVVSEYDASANKSNSNILNVAEQKLTANPETGLNTVGIVEVQETSFGTVVVYPNPASTSTNIALNLFSDDNVSINVYNALGQVVYTENNSRLSSGEHLLTINTSEFANGIYNVVVNTSKGMITKKVTISK